MLNTVLLKVIINDPFKLVLDRVGFSVSELLIPLLIDIVHHYRTRQHNSFHVPSCTHTLQSVGLEFNNIVSQILKGN